MSGDLRVPPVAGWLQRTLAMRTLRVASASVLSLVVMLLWGGACLSAQHTRDAAPTAFSSALRRDDGPDASAQRPTHRNGAQSARVGGRHQPLVRSRAGEGDADPTVGAALASSSVALFDDAAQSARTQLR